MLLPRVIKNINGDIIYHDRVQAREQAWDTTDDGTLVRTETDSEVAEKLGVSQQLVSEVVKNTTGSIIYHDRVKARQYYEERLDPSAVPTGTPVRHTSRRKNRETNITDGDAAGIVATG